MKTFTGIVEAACEIQEFLYDRSEALPADIREKLKEWTRPGSSPVDAVVNSAELLYARRDELDKETKELAAGLALIASQFNFHRMAENNRGSKLALTLMRMAQIKAPAGVKYHNKKDDPEALPKFIKPKNDKEETVELPADDIAG